MFVLGDSMHSRCTNSVKVLLSYTPAVVFHNRNKDTCRQYLKKKRHTACGLVRIVKQKSDVSSLVLRHVRPLY